MRPICTDVLAFCGLSVCLCLLVTTVKSVIPAKTDLQIYIPFGVYVDSDGRNERCAVTVNSWSVQINNVFWYAQKVSGPEASERRGRSPPQCWNHWGESIFSPPQYFPPHFCMLFLKLPLFVVMLQKILTQTTHRPMLPIRLAYVINKMANFYVCCDKLQ